MPQRRKIRRRKQNQRTKRTREIRGIGDLMIFGWSREYFHNRAAFNEAVCKAEERASEGNHVEARNAYIKAAQAAERNGRQGDSDANWALRQALAEGDMIKADLKAQLDRPAGTELGHALLADLLAAQRPKA